MQIPVSFSPSRMLHLLLFISVCSTTAFTQIATIGEKLPSWQEGMLDLHHINTGRGDAAFYIFPDGTTMLVDAGEMNPLGNRIFTSRNARLHPNDTQKPYEWIADYIRQVIPEHKEAVLDYAMITHFDSDHFGSIYHGAPVSASKKYALTGITGVGELIPIRHMIDRGYPDYNYPIDLKGKEMEHILKTFPRYQGKYQSIKNYWTFLEEQQQEREMKVMALEVGANDQIRLLYNKEAYPTFEVRNIKSNGTYWTGSANSTFEYFPNFSNTPFNELPGENPLSNAIRISYGNFSYFTGGDMPGDVSLGKPYWEDTETPAGPIIGEVDVTTLNHHGNRDAHNENFVKALQARVYVQQSWSSDHPGHEVLRRLTSTHLYPGKRDLFATNMLQANVDVIGPSLPNNYKSMEGHILIRVMPGGKEYYMIILDDESTERKVTNVFGPYTAKGKNYKLIAHRGGIVEGRYAENSESAIQAAIDRDYWMLEVDIRESKDGKLVVHHDEDFERFYGDSRKVADMLWEEISQLRTPQGTAPIQFETLAKLCQGKIRLMMDTKPPSHPKAFYQEMERILSTYDLLETAYFIGTQESQDYFKGKARIAVNREELKKKMEANEEVSQLYFLFEHGNELEVETVQFAQSIGVPVVPSVNLFHYRTEDPMKGAYEDITWLKNAGVTEFQIDSEYDRWLQYSGHKAGLSQGPFVGHLTTETAHIWARFDAPGTYTLHVWESGTTDTLNYSSNTDISQDFTITWKVAPISPNTTYTYRISQSSSATSSTGQHSSLATNLQTHPFQFTTPLPNDQIDSLTLVFGSCARDIPSIATPVWDAMGKQDPDLLVLIGDTPYIDATTLSYQQRRYKEFYEVSEFQQLLSTTPFYSVWDDHDFGKNDTDGNLEGKERSRTAFMQFRPNPTFGMDDQGIYTHFKRGPVEVFLLDTRWFAGTEASPFDSEQPTLLGKRQWEWLAEELRASTAEFKIIVSSMIFNGAVRPNKPDHWDSYPHEKEALFKLIGQHNISGVVLIGGDIHRSRLLTYDTESTAGYQISEFITSPLHTGVSEAANAPHPHLIFDAGVKESFLKMTALRTEDAPVLTLSCVTAHSGTPFEVSFTLNDLTADNQTSKR